MNALICTSKKSKQLLTIVNSWNSSLQGYFFFRLSKYSLKKTDICFSLSSMNYSKYLTF